MTRHDRYLQHITLDTGHVARSPRSGVDDAIVTLVRQMIDEALAGLSPEVQPGYTIKAASEGGSLMVSVYAGADNPICTIGVALDTAQSDTLWPLLRDLEGLATIGADPSLRPPKHPPDPPWCAVRLNPGLIEVRDATLWLGDFERCVAWAWIEGRSSP